MTNSENSHDHHRNRLPHWCSLHRLACESGIYRRSSRVALVVGTLLNLINQPEALLGLVFFDFHGIERLDVTKALLTYAIPFLVATYGAFTALEVRPVDSPDKPPA
jgi:hypothetical protein